MLLHFEIPASEISTLNQAVLAQSMGEILRSCRLGHHIFAIDRVACAAIEGCVSLMAADLALLRQLGREYVQSADLVRRARVYIAIRNVSEVTKNGRALVVPMSEIARPYTLDRAVVAIEDTVSDAAFYQFVLSNIRDLEKAPVVVCEFVHGGGDRLAAVVESKLNDRRIVCVVADSDLHAPGGSNSPKVRQLQQLAKAAVWPFVVVVVPPGKEVENLVPRTVLAALPCGVERRNELEILLRIEEAEDKLGTVNAERYHLFFDFKGGLNDEVLAKRDQGDATWIASRMSLAGLSTPGLTLAGFGSTIVSQIIASNGALSLLRGAIRRPEWWNTFGDDLAMVLWICASRPRQVT